MDEMKITSKLMRGVAAKLIRNIFKKKFGCDVKLNLNDFYVTYDETNANVHIDFNAQMDKDNLESVLLEADLI